MPVVARLFNMEIGLFGTKRLIVLTSYSIRIESYGYWLKKA